MLGDKDIVAVIAVKDIESGKKFYGDTLGLKFVEEDPGGALYKSGNSRVFVYPSQYAGSDKSTHAGWTVDDIDGTVKELQGKGIKFEEYDGMPQTKREGAIHIMGKLKMAWFKDPDGNILVLDNGAQYNQ